MGVVDVVDRCLWVRLCLDWDRVLLISLERGVVMGFKAIKFKGCVQYSPYRLKSLFMYRGALNVAKVLLICHIFALNVAKVLLICPILL